MTAIVCPLRRRDVGPEVTCPCVFGAVPDSKFTAEFGDELRISLWAGVDGAALQPYPERSEDRLTLALLWTQRLRRCGKDAMSTEEVAPFQVTISTDGWTRVIHLYGELDLATIDAVDQACYAGSEFDVQIDMAQLSFLDCTGYSGLEAIRRGLEAQSGSLTIHAVQGQPLRILNLIAEIEHRPAVHAEDRRRVCDFGLWGERPCDRHDDCEKAAVSDGVVGG